MTKPNALFPKGLYVYDIETLSNFFSVVFMSDTETHVFYIHDLDNRRARIECWNKLKQFMSRVKLLVGYNNLYFDRPVLDYVLKSHTTANAVYRFAQKIIDGHRHNTEVLFNVRELDLYKMNHFDSDAKRTSLKHLQFAMKYENVMDMPIHHSTSISRKQVDTVIEYNINDVKSTMEFYIKCKRGIEIRKIIGDKYELDLTNDSEPTISKKVFGSILSKNLGIELDALYQMRTPRDVIHIKDIILPYVEFKSPEFNFVLDYFKSMSISVLKGAFENIDVTNVDRSYLNSKRLKIKRKGKDVTVLSKSLHTMFDGEEYVYGTGGIHSKIEGLIVIPKDDEVILDLDVKNLVAS